jgi:hypothetical protein
MATTTSHLVHGMEIKRVTKSKSPSSIQYASRKQNVDTSFANATDVHHFGKTALSARKSNENIRERRNKRRSGLIHNKIGTLISQSLAQLVTTIQLSRLYFILSLMYLFFLTRPLLGQSNSCLHKILQRQSAIFADMCNVNAKNSRFFLGDSIILHY